MVSLTPRQWCLYCLSALLSLIVVFIGRDGFTHLASGSVDGKVPVSELLHDLNQIQIRNGDTWSGTPETFDKGVITGVIAHIRSNAPKRDIMSYYRGRLASQGWVPSNLEKYRTENKIKFCKGSVSIIIDASIKGAPSAYYLGLTWTRFEQLPAYCPD